MVDAPADAASLIAPIERYAAEAPRRPAIVSPAGTIDMGTLHARALSGAAWLVAAGVRPGMIVGLSWRSEPAHLQMLYALARLSAVVLPLDRDAAVPERGALARRVGAEAIVGDHAETAVPGLRSIVPDAGAWTASGPLPPPPGRETPWLFSLSAGSTGQQKAILYTHRHEILRISRLPDLIGAGPEDRYLAVIEIGFNLGRVAALRMLHYGGMVVFPPPMPDVATLAAVTRDHAISWMVLTPN
ncbi:MAG: AMP-binding protein, partial [Alphaproteobacteria bacterium]